MKKSSLALLIALVPVLAFVSCKKINEATTLGNDIIPGVDNVSTFETSLHSKTRNAFRTDSAKVTVNDDIALGHIDDPRFGSSHANAAFSVIPSTLGIYPFGIYANRDSVKVDSVVLSLSYQGAYGDTLGNGVQTFHVYEVSQSSGFRYDTLYRFADPLSDFTAIPGGTTGPELGSKTFTIRRLADSIPLPRRKADSNLKTANEVRILLNNSLGQRFVSYDTSGSVTTGAYFSDSTAGGHFRKLFAGLAIKADNNGNALSYYNITDFAKSKLTVYYRSKNAAGSYDTSSYDFVHNSIYGQADYVKHTPGGAWLNAINTTGGDSTAIYLQGTPSGAFGQIVIPALDTFKNKVIHRAEIIASVIQQDARFPEPRQLFLDRYRKGAVDTAFLFQNDLAANPDQSISFDLFGGNLHSSEYRFNITRYVQSIVTKHEKNDTLRIFSALRANVFATNLGIGIAIPVQSRVAEGRVVLGGGDYVDPKYRLRLRIVYSNL